MGNQQKKQAWVVAIDMGYGHQRAAFPLRHLSPDKTVFIANNYPGMPKSDYNYWHYGQAIYELVSRATRVPLIGPVIFGVMDSLQAIKSFDPKKKELGPTAQLRQTYSSIKSGRGKHLVEQLNTKDIPLITSFFTIAFMAEEHGFKNDIYLIICDTDISRAWAPYHPEKSRIKYCASTERAAERLKTYGVRPENIFLTGFPLPDENIGGLKETILKKDMIERLRALDPEKATRPPTLTYAVGGAGAQKQVAYDIVKSLRADIIAEKIVFNLIAGTRPEVNAYFQSVIRQLGLTDALGKTVNVIYKPTKVAYFEEFDRVMRTTDVLWTKPSELVFYASLGLPIIIGHVLGSQEEYNQAWLQQSGAGILQSNPRRTHEWFFEWLVSGALAKAAKNALEHGEKHAVEKIEQLVFKKK